MRHTALRLLDPNLKHTSVLTPVLKSRTKVPTGALTTRLPPRSTPKVKRSASKIVFRVRKLKGCKQFNTVSNAENVYEELQNSVKEELSTTATNMMQTPDSSPLRSGYSKENSRYSKVQNSQNLLSPLKSSVDFISID